MEVTDYRFRKLAVPERTLGDSQTGRFETDTLEYGYLELETDEGFRGVGFDVVNFRTPGSLSETALRDRLEPLAADVIGASPFARRNRLSRHRGGAYNYYSSGSYGQGFGRMIDYALWDLCGKHLDLPLYELMGGDDPCVPVYASGLSFPNDDETTRAVYEEFASVGTFAGAKVKVGFETAEADIERLRLVRDVLGQDTTLLADANEAWTPKETIQRLQAYRDAGIDLYWIEDPVLRDDVKGIRQVVEAIDHTYVTMGDYVRLAGKRELLENGACDILNVHGMSPARRAAVIAGIYGTPVGVGTDHSADIGAMHVGASLPEVRFMEFANHRFWHLVDRPFEIDSGYAVAPDRPGHGVELDEPTIEEFRETDA